MSATASHAGGRAHAHPPARLPGPAGHPLLGMAAALRRDLLGTLQDGFAQHGDVVAYRVGPARGPRRLRQLLVAVRHPDDVRRVMVETDVFVRRTPSHDVVRELFGETIVTLESERWRQRKRILQPLFTRRRVSQYTGLLKAEADRVTERWRDLGVHEVDVMPAMEQHALRVLGQTIFAQEDLVDGVTAAALERLVPRLGEQVAERVMQALRPPLFVPTPRNRRFRALRAELHGTIERVLARGERDDRDGAGDLLSRLRDARDPHDGAALPGRGVRDEAFMLMLAGYTTTADVLISALHLLGRHPDVQERVAASARDSAGGDAEDLVHATMREAMRLHPPSYALGRRAAADTELGGHPVPAGALVVVVPWATHRDPRFWPDPERFDPFRFVGEHDRPRFAYMPFGGGPRACIGRHVAMLESTTMIRAVLRRYRIESLDATLPLSQLMSMRPLGPVRVRLIPREPAGAAA